MTATLLTEEELLLTRSEALAILQPHLRTVIHIERCCDDGAVLFIGAFKRPWTAWIDRTDGEIVIQYEEGWSAEFGTNSRVSQPVTVPSATPPG